MDVEDAPAGFACRSGVLDFYVAVSRPPPVQLFFEIELTDGFDSRRGCFCNRRQQHAGVDSPALFCVGSVNATQRKKQGHRQKSLWHLYHIHIQSAERYAQLPGGARSAASGKLNQLCCVPGKSGCFSMRSASIPSWIRVVVLHSTIHLPHRVISVS